MRHWKTLGTMVLFAVGSAGCAQYTRQTEASEPVATGSSAPAVVNVINNNMQDVEVFLNQSKMVQRLGTVGTGQTATLEIPAGELKNRNDVTLAVKLIGTSSNTESWISERLLVHPGDEFNLTVAPFLEHSRINR